MDSEKDMTIYKVVVNHEEQYSIYHEYLLCVGAKPQGPI